MSTIDWALMTGEPKAFRVVETMQDGQQRALAMYPILQTEQGLPCIIYGIAEQVLVGPSPEELANAVCRIEAQQIRVRAAMGGV